uniref:AlNc14C731G12458 protein n=1 Tax=Albugo laibachii Nc14 TaxID=890382 RepID=F0X1Y0_9STRA|nr:AlNc14C731G12458 [Albugo laibachii Nc14]|eukprot:CCA27839.1 AlNc14C731G12458 [Albugo laibachii Nc14]
MGFRILPNCFLIPYIWLHGVSTIDSKPASNQDELSFDRLTESMSEGQSDPQRDPAHTPSTSAGSKHTQNTADSGNTEKCKSYASIPLVSTDAFSASTQEELKKLLFTRTCKSPKCTCREAPIWYRKFLEPCPSETELMCVVYLREIVKPSTEKEPKTDLGEHITQQLNPYDHTLAGAITCHQFKELTLDLFRKYVSVVDFVLDLLEYTIKPESRNTVSKEERDNKNAIYQKLSEVDDAEAKLMQRYAIRVSSASQKSDYACQKHAQHAPGLLEYLVSLIKKIKSAHETLWRLSANPSTRSQ